MAECNPGPSFVKSSKFGERRDPFDSTRVEFRTGVDFSAPSGTEIRAASDGTVVYSAFNKGGFDYGGSVRKEELEFEK